MIFLLFIPFLLFAGAIENNISKIYKEAYPNIKIEKIIIHNNKKEPIKTIYLKNINTKKVSGTIRVNNFYILYRIIAKIKVLKSTDTINKNEPVDYSNSQLTWVTFRNLYAYPQMSYTKKVAKMYISRNRIIFQYMLKAKNMVSRNQLITIISHSGGIEVSFEATALQNGQPGDRIKVRKDNRTFFVTIDKNGEGRL